MQQMNVLKEER